MRTPARPVPGLPLEAQPEGILHRILLWGEARGETDDAGALESVAMLAVAFVPANRAARRKTSIRAEILRPWQFSCFNANDPNRAKLLDAPTIDPASWERADTVVDLFESGLVLDPSRGATHYVVASLWNRDPLNPASIKWFEAPEIAARRTVELVRLGHHVFAGAA